MKWLDPLRYNVATIQSDDLLIREVGDACNQALAVPTGVLPRSSVLGVTEIVAA